MMPALPGPHLVLVHARFTLASFKARFNAGARLIARRASFPATVPSVLCAPRTRRGQIVAIIIAGILIAGLPARLPPHVPASHAGRRVTTSHSSNPVRLRSSRVCTFMTISIPTRAGPAISHRQVDPCLRVECPWRQTVTDCHDGFGGLPRP